MKNIHSILLAGLLSLMLGSCRTIAPSYDYRELARASLRMGMDIDMKDNHALYVVSSQWLGVPYRIGGTSKRGVDCSGFTSSVYQEVYRKKLRRSSNEQRKKDCRKIKKRKLKNFVFLF